MTANDDRGFSIMELMVAVLVLSIAVVGLFRVFGTSAALSGAESDRQLALIVARNRAEEIALDLPGLSDSVELAGREWDILTERELTSGGFQRIELRVSRSDGGGATLFTYAAGDRP